MNASKKELFYNRFSDKWKVIMEEGLNKIETNKRIDIIFKDLFRGIKLKNAKFLEAGCGLGFFSKEAFLKGAIVTGIDVGDNLVNICRKKIPKGKFLVASASNLPFKNNSFDIVLCTEVVEHVENQVKTISELYRVVKPGGYVVVTTPNKVWHPIFNFLSFIKVRPYHGNEKWFYTWELKNLLDKTGFEVVKSKYFNFIYPNKLLNNFERINFLKDFMINQGYLLKKIK